MGDYISIAIHYGGATALGGVSLSLGEGEIVALMGGGNPSLRGALRTKRPMQWQLDEGRPGGHANGFGKGSFTSQVWYNPGCASLVLIQAAPPAAAEH